MYKCLWVIVLHLLAFLVLDAPAADSATSDCPTAVRGMDHGVQIDAWLESDAGDWSHLLLVCRILHPGSGPHPFEFSVRALPLYLGVKDDDGKEVQPTRFGRQFFMQSFDGRMGGGFMSNLHDSEIPPRSALLVKIPFAKSYELTNPGLAQISLLWNPLHGPEVEPSPQLHLKVPASPGLISAPKWAEQYAEAAVGDELAWVITEQGRSESAAVAKAAAGKAANMRAPSPVAKLAWGVLKDAPAGIAALVVLSLALVFLVAKRRSMSSPAIRP